MKMPTTIRIPQEKLRILRAIAGYEGKSMSEIISELIDEYIERHKETMELIGIPGFVEECKKGLEEIKSGKGKSLSELED